MRILVTGGAGFIGSHLCESLLAANHEVICLDNFYTGRIRNVQHLQDNVHFEVIRWDITLPIQLEVDGIFNLACPASPIHYQKDPVATLKTNVLGAINVLDLAKNKGVRVLQASTSEIYGDPLENPQKESYWGNVNPNGIRACYDEGKRAAETLFYDYHRQLGVDIRVARIFNTYGPQMLPDDGRVVSNFIMQALRDQEITLYGDGSQLRSFCYVSDLIDGLMRLFFTDSIVEPINLGNPQPINMFNLATEIIGMTNSNSIIGYRPLPKDDPKIREPNIQKAYDLLAWQPRVDRHQGLMKTVDYFARINSGAVQL